MARWLLRVAITASLLIAALLNGVVWSVDRPGRGARWTAHFTNACMLIVAVLVARLSPVAPAYLILLCSVLLTLAAVINDRSADLRHPSSAQRTEGPDRPFGPAG